MERQLSFLASGHMGEIKLADVKAMSHRKDPLPSKEAAASVETDGTAEDRRRRLLKNLWAYDGQTGPELQRVTGIGYHEVYRRLSDLCKEKKDRRTRETIPVFVERRDSEKPCAVTGENRSRYWLIKTPQTVRWMERLGVIAKRAIG